MKKIFVLSLVLVAAPCMAQISEKFLDAVAIVESNGKAVIGDNGRARGQYQMWRGAWLDAQKVDQSIGDYETGSMDSVRSRKAAKAYLSKLYARLHRALGRTPTNAEVYAAWNIGFKGYQQRGFNLSKTPATTQKAIKRLEALL